MESARLTVKSQSLTRTNPTTSIALDKRIARMKNLLLLLISLLATSSLFAQKDEIRPWNAVGIRFASYLNWHPRGNEFLLQDGAYTTGALGAYYKRFGPTTGFEVGLNLNYKNGDDRGFPNLPVVMRDWGADSQNVGLTSVELDFKAGPRFGILHPKIGYVFGYRLRRSGYLTDAAPSTWRINRLYILLPIGMSVDLPVRWGSVGFGGFFHVGLLNVVSEPSSNQGNWEGGRLRAVSFEVIVSYGRR